jgi:hypothetical protein
MQVLANPDVQLLRFCVSTCALQIRTFFASPDALHAAFWPQQGQQQQQQQHSDDKPSSSNPAGDPNNSSLSQQQEHPQQQSAVSSPAAAAAGMQQRPAWLQIDHAAVQQLHDRLEGCHSEAVRDALLEGGQQLLLHISYCFHQGRDNPGFCRQVCYVLIMAVILLL